MLLHLNFSQLGRPAVTLAFRGAADLLFRDSYRLRVMVVT